MKLIDEKGKLFGKINIVDLLVILLVAVVAVVLGLKFLGGGGDTGVPVEQSTLTYTVLVEEVTPQSYENILAFVDRDAGRKDQLMATGEMVNAYVVDVTASDHVPSPDDTLGEGTLDLVFTIEAVTNDVRTGNVGTQEVRIGKSHIVKTVHFEFEDGIVLTCQWGE